MTIVDADALAQLIIGGFHHGLARDTFLKDPEWAAPPLWRSDFRGLLARRIASGEISMAGAIRAFDAACLVIAGNEPEPATAAVFALIKSGVDPYDAEYVAVAKELGVPLFTTDSALQTLL